MNDMHHLHQKAKTTVVVFAGTEVKRITYPPRNESTITHDQIQFTAI